MTVVIPDMIVEDGTIVEGANSYVTLDYANNYMALNIHASASWDALSDDDKQALLQWSTRYLDQRATWNGCTATSYLNNDGNGTNYVETWAVVPNPPPAIQQSLRWPRYGVYDIDDNCIPYNVMPKQLLDATCEMARYMITTDRSIERPQDGLTELKVDVITLKFLTDYELPAVPSQISFMIRNLGTISSGRTFGAKIRRV